MPMLGPVVHPVPIRVDTVLGVVVYPVSVDVVRVCVVLGRVGHDAPFLSPEGVPTQGKD
jgi:hypothetical protein